MIVLILLFVLSSTLCSQSADSLSGLSSINLKTYTEQEEVPLNREVIYQVELSWDGPLNRLEIEQIDEPLTTNLKLRSSGSSNKFYQDAQGKPHSIKKITYYFTPVEIGMAYIDGVIVKYNDVQLGQKSSLMAQRLAVKVISPVDEPGGKMLKANSILWLITVIFLGIVGYFTYRYFQRKSQAKEEEVLLNKSLEDKYLDLLHETIHPAADSTDENLAELVRLLRSYLSEKSGNSGISILETTKNPEWAAPVENDLIDKLKKLYDKSELIKFAGESMSQSDFHMHYDTVEMFLKKQNENKPEVNGRND